MSIMLVGVQVPPLAPRSFSWLARLIGIACLMGIICGGCKGPEQVVKDAIAAAQSNDQEAYLACFTPRSRAILKLLWKNKTPPLSADNAQVVATERFGPQLTSVQVQEGALVVPIILRGGVGQWRIDLIDMEAVLTDHQAPF